MTTPADTPADAAPKSRSRYFQRFLLSVIPHVERRVQSVPRLTALGYGRRFGDLAYTLAAKARNTAYKNLRYVYGDALDDAGRTKIVRGVFRHFGMMTMDFLRGPLLQTPADLQELIASVSGWDDNIESVLFADRGVVICTAHFGNWELLGRYIVSQGVPLTVVARDPEDPGFAAWARRMRGSAGFAVSGKGEPARKLVSALKRGEALAILPDQNSGDVFVPFFGVPSGTAIGPALLAFRTNAVVVTCVATLDADAGYKYHLAFDSPLDLHDTGDKQTDYSRTMTQINARLEARIRERPEQWLWLHDRWKATFEAYNREKLPKGLDLDALRERFR